MGKAKPTSLEAGWIGFPEAGLEDPLQESVEPVEHFGISTLAD